MNLKKLLDLFEAPANLNYKGTSGTRAIQQATNQAKPGAIKNVNIIKPGQQLTLPGSGSYTVKAGDTMDKIAKSNPPAATPTATTATAPVTNAVAPSTDNETLKGQVITKAMSPAVPASVPAADSLSPGETVVDNPTPDTRGAVAMASKSSAPVAAEPDSTAVAAAPTTQSDIPPGRQLYGYVSEEDAELNELMRLSGRPVNEKAVSKQQQKFMGMVHAMQKGKKIKGASPELKKVAKTMSKKDAKDFASTKHKGLPTKVSESVMLEAGSALEHIINKFKHETKNFLAGEELDHDLFEALFDYYSDNGEMPYGVAKARDGDPYQWIDNKFEQDLSMMGHQRDFNTAGLGHDHELTELARLAGLTNEDGPGASRLYGDDKTTNPDFLPTKKASSGFDPVDTLKRVANKGIDAFNDYEQRKKDRWDSLPFGGEPGPGHSGYIPSRLPKFQTKADTELADKDKTTAPIATPAATKADALTGAANAAAADTKRVKEDAELKQMRRIAGLDEARGAPEIGSKLPKSDVETFGLEPGRTYKTNPPKDWKQGDKPRALQQVIPTADKKDHIRSRLGKHVRPAHLPEGAINECGDMGMDQQDSMNVSTNMSSDGTKSVTISAQGDQAAALIDMLRLAGMDSSHVAQDSEPEIVMVGGNEELEESVNYDKVLDAIAALFGDDIWDSDVMQDLANDLEQAGPTDQELDFIIAQGRLPKRLAGIQFAAGDDVQFREEMMDENGVPIQQIPYVEPNKSQKLPDYVRQPGGPAGADAQGSRVTPKSPGALEEVKKRTTKYSNTPDEEYETVHAITRQGNDLNREKRQYAGKPKLGDNPMAEGVYDPDYRGNYNNEFDELEDLFSKSAMDSSEMNRQRFLANKYGINSPSDMSKLPALRKDAEAGYKTRKSEIDADLEKRNQQYMQDKLMDLEYQADPSAFLQRRMQRSEPRATEPTKSDAPKADYSLGGRGAKLPNFNLEPAAPDANDLLDKTIDQLDSRLRSRPSMTQQLAQLRNRTRQSRMAESLLDADLDAMLESILIREDDNDNAAKKAGDAVKNPSDAAKDVGDKVKGRLSFSKDAEGKTSIKSSTGRIRATIDGNKTHYEPGEPAEKEKTDEGWMDDVSDFVGDVVGTEASKLRHSQQLRDLDAMRQQYKGTPYEKQVNDRYQTHLDRLQADKGEVVDKKGEPIKVLPPDQWKGGN